MSVNVNRGVTDPFYRYKMPKLLAKVEGKGNGIKTVVVNMVEIAKALNRPPMYPCKFFGCILGAQTQFDKNERYIVNGSHDSVKLQTILDTFIQRYVLCQGCSNPETDLKVSAKRGTIQMSCKACGHHCLLIHKDKLVPYILKNPPTEQQAVDTSAKKEKKEKRKGKKDQDSDEQPETEEILANDQDNNDDDSEDWGEDTDADAVARRMNMLSSGVNRLMANSDLEKSAEDRLQLFFEYFKNTHKNCGGVFDTAAQREIVAKADSWEIRDKCVLVLCELLFNEQMLQQIKQYRPLLLRFCSENTKAQKYMLKGFELTVKEYSTQLLPKVGYILQAFYDEDIIDEKVILDWGDKAYKKTVGKELAEKIHQKAAPFLKWLREAEEDDSDEDEEEELNVVYDDRVRADKIQVQKEETPPKAAPINHSADDELDIDAI